VTGEAKPDFAITAQIAKQMGIELEDTTASLVFDRLARSVKSFEGLNYAKLMELRPQWPVVGRSDLFYGGTTYENKHGMGATLSNGASRGETVSIPKVRASRESAPRPAKDELLAVPISKLYHRGTTVMKSADLLRQWIGQPTISLHPDAAERLGVQEGDLVSVGVDGTNREAKVKLDDTISVGVALIPRSMELAINEPVAVKISVPEKVE
jgi:predicted molibdopterin-dependent oxidoreductase YjgC